MDNEKIYELLIKDVPQLFDSHKLSNKACVSEKFICIGGHIDLKQISTKHVQNICSD